MLSQPEFRTTCRSLELPLLWKVSFVSATGNIVTPFFIVVEMELSVFTLQMEGRRLPAISINFLEAGLVFWKFTQLE